MNKKVFGIIVLFLISLIAVNAQYECEWNGDCPGGTCIVEQGRSYCKYPEQIITPPTLPPEQPVTPPTLPPEQPVTPPILPPEQPVTPPTLPPEQPTGYCGNGLLERDLGEQCEVDAHCLNTVYNTCDRMCKCISLSTQLPPETSEVKQCPPNTVPVMEEGMFYCLEMKPATPGVEPVIPQPSVAPTFCDSKVFYLHQGEETTELTFSLPWIPEEAYLVNEGQFLPVNFEDQKVILSLNKGDYLIKAVNDGEEFNLQFKVLEAPELEELPIVSPVSAEVLVHAQGGDEEQGKLLVDYLKKLGFNTQFSNSRSVESVSSAKILIFLGGNLANNLVSKYFPDISESLFNLNTNQFVKQMGDQFVMSFASWCADGTKESVNELKEELNYELESGDSSNVKGLLTNRKNVRGKDVVCMPGEPELVEDLKSRRRGTCPNAELCDAVCN
ncbi:hypothetical protein COV11_00310, partial [Candidatus Woesearchaeota archaeon CG10_big_fil_rev_8_21_14_0_10_30_7]